MGGKIEALEQQVKSDEKVEHKVKAEFKSNNESIESQMNVITQLKNNIKDDQKFLADKEKEIGKFGNLFQTLKDNEKNDADALAAAEDTYNKINAGYLQSDTGENATMEQQIINAKESAAQAQTDLKKCELDLKHNQELLQKKTKDLSNTSSDYKKDSQALEVKEKEVKNLENHLKKFNYQEGHIEGLNQQRQELMREVHHLRDRVDNFESNYPNLRFNYQKPHPTFDERSVKGLVCKLITVKDKQAAYALDITAGGRVMTFP